MRMYSVIVLPMAEEDIVNNTDYIAFEKKAPETALHLAMGFRNTIAKCVAYACKCKTISAENEVLVQIDSYFLLT